MNNKKIIRNAIQCKQCNAVIESAHRHDFVRCPCKAVFVDGGKEYLRRGYSGDSASEAYIDLSVQ